MIGLFSVTGYAAKIRHLQRPLMRQVRRSALVGFAETIDDETHLTDGETAVARTVSALAKGFEQHGVAVDPAGQAVGGYMLLAVGEVEAGQVALGVGMVFHEFLSF